MCFYIAVAILLRIYGIGRDAAPMAVKEALLAAARDDSLVRDAAGNVDEWLARHRRASEYADEVVLSLAARYYDVEIIVHTNGDPSQYVYVPKRAARARAHWHVALCDQHFSPLVLTIDRRRVRYTGPFPWLSADDAQWPHDLGELRSLCATCFCSRSKCVVAAAQHSVHDADISDATAPQPTASAGTWRSSVSLHSLFWTIGL